MSRITNKQEIVQTIVDEVLIGRKCDFCDKEIEMPDKWRYNYFLIHTWHNDWGNDSIESHEYYDACCPECVMNFTKKYIEKSFKDPCNSRCIEIKHCRTLQEGTPKEANYY